MKIDNLNRHNKCFAFNLKRFRKERGITQAQLAEVLCYTEKTVSKWESGKVIPPIDTIMLICDYFCINIDELFSYEYKPEYYLGIDGGATKTTFALAEADGNIINKLYLQCSNPFDIGFEKSTEILSEGIKKVSMGIPLRKISLFAGLSGGVSANMQVAFSQFFHKFNFARYKNGSDIENILEVGLGNEDGVALIMGTGSSAFVQKNGVSTLIGGLGYLFSHFGSGYDIGNHGIRASLMYECGMGPKTIIRDIVLSKIGGNSVHEHLFDFYNAGKRGIASYCKCVFEAFDKGDKIAENIICKNMEHIADLMVRGREILGTDTIKVVVVGGLTNRMDILMPVIKEHLKTRDSGVDYHIDVYEDDVVNGALIKAGISREKIVTKKTII